MKTCGPAPNIRRMTNTAEPAVPLRLTVNGEPHEVSAPMSVGQLLVRLGLEPRRIAVERNLEIVPKSLYGVTILDEGDRIEIVQFVGGG